MSVARPRQWAEAPPQTTQPLQVIWRVSCSTGEGEGEGEGGAGTGTGTGTGTTATVGEGGGEGEGEGGGDGEGEGLVTLDRGRQLARRMLVVVTGAGAGMGTGLGTATIVGITTGTAPQDRVLGLGQGFIYCVQSICHAASVDIGDAHPWSQDASTCLHKRRQNIYSPYFNVALLR